MRNNITGFRQGLESVMLTLNNKEVFMENNIYPACPTGDGGNLIPYPYDFFCPKAGIDMPKWPILAKCDKCGQVFEQKDNRWDRWIKWVENTK